MKTNNKDTHQDPDSNEGAELSRRDFIKLSGSTIAAGSVAGSLAASLLPSTAGAQSSNTGGYPVVDIASLADIGEGAAINFNYPDERSPALLMRLAESTPEGIGPDQQIVAYSRLCTHKGCPVTWRAERKLLICPCHWSSFDPAKSGQLVIGQASQSLPRIDLRIEGDIVQAVGVQGLIYGRHTNIL